MAGEIVALNAFLQERADSVKTLFSAGHSLRLFSNDWKPKPNATIVDFAEASYPGYARKDLATAWKDVFKVKDGEWQFSSNDLTFVATGASNTLAYGWYIVGAGKAKVACRLPFPNLMTIGSPLTVRIDLIVWAASIL